MKPAEVLANVPWWLVLVTAALGLVGLAFIHSATLDRPDVSEQYGKQALFLACGFGLSFLLLFVPYGRTMRVAWLLYGLALVALALLPWFAPMINGARRWYTFPGFSIQPSEFAKPIVVVTLAAMLRFKTRSTTFEGLLVPMAVAAVPALLVLRQPDLGSSIVFWPVLLAMCWAAGAPTRGLLAVLGIGLVGAVLAYFFVIQGYQKVRIDTWAAHYGWAELLANPALDREAYNDMIQLQRGAAYQPWQALIAMGSGGWLGHGYAQGPQNRYDFLPYRSEDYVFAVVGEETGLLGCAAVLLLVACLVFGLLALALRRRERFGRLVCVGIATWIGFQSLMHAAVNNWMIPSTGVPMPFLSYGGSSTLAVMLSMGLCWNIGARREVVIAPDGYR